MIKSIKILIHSVVAAGVFVATTSVGFFAALIGFFVCGQLPISNGLESDSSNPSTPSSPLLGAGNRKGFSFDCYSRANQRSLCPSF